MAAIDFVLSLLIALGMMAVALVPALWWQRKQRISWRWFLWGASLISLALGVKFVFNLLLNARVNLLLNAYLPSTLAPLAFFVFIGLQTVLSEVGLTYVLVKNKFKSAKISEVVGFGIGFGGMEASILGLLALVLTILAGLFPQILPSALTANTVVDPLVAPAPVLERAAAIALHVLCSLWLYEAAVSGRWTSLIKAAVVKGSLDTYAPMFGPLKGMGTTGIYLLELPIYLWGLAAICGLRNYLKSESRRIGTFAKIFFAIGLLAVGLVALLAPRLGSSSTAPSSPGFSVENSLSEINPACNYPLQVYGDRLAPQVNDGERLVLDKCLENKENLAPGTVVVFQEKGNPSMRLGIIAKKTELAEGLFYQVTMNVKDASEVAISPEDIVAVRN